MKLSSLLAGLGVCVAFAGTANAKIVTGTSEGYLSKVYATDLSGNRLPDFDATCRSTHSAMVNSFFYADFRVNTETKNNVAFLYFAGNETQLTNSGFCSERNKYVFSSGTVPAALSEKNVKSVEFTLDYDMWHASTKVVFNSVTGKPAHTDSCDGHHDHDHCDYHHDHCTHCDGHHDHPETAEATYQCVLSTY